MSYVTVAMHGIGNIAQKFEPNPGLGYRLVMVRCHFLRASGSGTDVANLIMSVDSERSRNDNHSRFNHQIWVFRDVGVSPAGVNADAFLWVEPERREAFKFGAHDWLTFAWTNPDSGEIEWGLEVTVEDV